MTQDKRQDKRQEIFAQLLEHSPCEEGKLFMRFVELFEVDLQVALDVLVIFRPPFADFAFKYAPLYTDALWSGRTTYSLPGLVNLANEGRCTLAQLVEGMRDPALFRIVGVARRFVEWLLQEGFDFVAVEYFGDWMPSRVAQHLLREYKFSALYRIGKTQWVSRKGMQSYLSTLIREGGRDMLHELDKHYRHLLDVYQRRALNGALERFGMLPDRR